MALPTAPAWDSDETCVWFEIAYKGHTILCRIDASCLVKSLGSASMSESASRIALKAHWPRVHALALAHADAGNLESAPNRARRFVRLTNKNFLQTGAAAPAGA
jgi:uncharacterized protein DUF1488